MNDISLEEIKKSIRDVPDFPKEGILFKDLSTAFKDPVVLKKITSEIKNYYSDKGITKVAAIEARGFIMGSILAHTLGAGFIPLRKPGKLPADTYNVKYDLEYGTDSIEIHKDAIEPGDIVLLHDDLLATGGTMNGAVELIRKFKVRKIYINFIVELTFLHGRNKIEPGLDVFSLLEY